MQISRPTNTSSYVTGAFAPLIAETLGDGQRDGSIAKESTPTSWPWRSSVLCRGPFSSGISIRMQSTWF